MKDEICVCGHVHYRNGRDCLEGSCLCSRFKPVAAPALPEPPRECAYCGLSIRETHMGHVRNEWEHMNGVSFCADGKHWAWPTPLAQKQVAPALPEVAPTNEWMIHANNLRLELDDVKAQLAAAKGGWIDCKQELPKNRQDCEVICEAYFDGTQWRGHTGHAYLWRPTPPDVTKETYPGSGRHFYCACCRDYHAIGLHRPEPTPPSTTGEV